MEEVEQHRQKVTNHGVCGGGCVMPCMQEHCECDTKDPYEEEEEIIRMQQQQQLKQQQQQQQREDEL
jgi:hypothetical protein